jgi:mutator protein MutT
MIQVTAAVIEKEGRVLIARRGGDGPFADLWEFPGGKVEPGETNEQGLARELSEELGIRAQVGVFLCASRHDYGHLAVELLAYRVFSYQGEIRLNEHTEIRWVWPRDLSRYEFPEADLPIIRKILEDA